MRPAPIFGLSILLLAACGGGDSDAAPDRAGEPQTFHGGWLGRLTLVEDTCDLAAVDPTLDSLDYDFEVHQSGAAVRVDKPFTCLADGPYVGSVAAGTLTATRATPFDCGGGRSAALVQTLTIAEVTGDEGHSSVAFEVACPGQSCVISWAGPARRNAPLPLLCSGDPAVEPPSAPPSTPPPAPSPAPDDGGPDLQGCCSSHGGVAMCRADGRVECNDGALSLSCRC